MAATKIAQRLVHTGGFVQDQAQRLAQQVATKVNSLGESLAARLVVLERRAFGLLQFPMANVNTIVTPSQAAYPMFQVTGALTATRTLTFPVATDGSAYLVWITNVTTGGFGLTIASSGTTATVASLTTRLVRISASGAAVMV
jgi:hypothetical protein